MYLIYVPNADKPYLLKDLSLDPTLDSPFFSWVYDYKVGVFRCENNQYEYLKIQLSVWNTWLVKWIPVQEQL